MVCSLSKGKERLNEVEKGAAETKTFERKFPM